MKSTYTKSDIRRVICLNPQSPVISERHIDASCSRIVRLRTQDSSTAGFSRWRKWVLLIWICGIAAALLAGCRKSEKEDSSSAKNIEVSIPLVDSVTLYDEYPATLLSDSESSVVAKVSGTILSKHFDAGQYVKKGQLLYVIESTTYSAAVNQARAEVESAKSKLDYVNTNLKALQEAYAANAVSEMEVQEARSSRDQAIASLNSAQAALEAQSLKLGYCRVTAPISGKISASLLDVGEYVAGEGSPVQLCRIYNDDDLLVDFSIPEAVYSKISSEGGLAREAFRHVPVIISASPSDDATPANVFTGELMYEAPNVSPTSGSINLRVRIKNPTAYLRSGMYAKVKLPVSTVSDALLVRDASISTDQRGSYLYTIDSKNEVAHTPIVTGGLYNDSLRLVKSGISRDTRYVTRAMINVRTGEKVNPVNVSPR